MATFDELYLEVVKLPAVKLPTSSIDALNQYGKMVDKYGGDIKKNATKAAKNIAKELLGPSKQPVKRPTSKTSSSTTRKSAGTAPSTRKTTSSASATTRKTTPAAATKKTTPIASIAKSAATAATKKTTYSPAPIVNQTIQSSPKPAPKMPNTTSATKAPSGDVLTNVIGAAKEAITLSQVKTPNDIERKAKDAYKRGKHDGYQAGIGEYKDKLSKAQSSAKSNREYAQKAVRAARGYKMRLKESEQNLERVQGTLDKHIKGEKTAAAVLGMAVAVLAVSKGISKLLPSGRKTEKVQVILQQANDLQRQSEEIVKKDLDTTGEVSPETVRKVKKLGKKADKLVDKAQKAGLAEATGITEESAAEIYNIVESCDNGYISEEEMNALIFEIL